MHRLLGSINKRFLAVYLLCVVAVLAALVLPNFYSFLMHGTPHVYRFVPFVIMNTAAAIMMTALVMACQSLSGRRLPLLVGILLTLIFMVGLVDIEVRGRFGFGYSPRLFAYFGLEEVSFAIREYRWNLLAIPLLSAVFYFLLKKLFGSIDFRKTEFASYAVLAILLMVPSSYILASRWGSHAKLALPIVSAVSEANRYYFSTAHEPKISWSDSELAVADELGMRFTSPASDAPLSIPGSQPNLIVVFLEGFNASYIYDGFEDFPDLTPNLTRMAGTISSSKLFYGSVDDTQNGVVSSLCGLMTVYGDHRWSNSRIDSTGGETIECLSDYLNWRGYHTSLLWGDSPTFAGMNEFTAAQNFDLFMSKNEITRALPTARNSAHGKLYDHDLFKFAINFIEHRERGQPYFMTLISHDTHFPYEVSPDCPEYALTPGAVSWDDTILATYQESNDWLKSVHCTDAAIGMLWDYLDESGELDNTAFLVVGDHMNWRDISRHGTIFFAAHSPVKTLPLEVEYAGHTPDLAPTALYLLGIELEQFHFGRNYYGSRAKYQHLVAPNFDVIDGQMSEILQYQNRSPMSGCSEAELVLPTGYPGQHPGARHLTQCERAKLLSQQPDLLY